MADERQRCTTCHFSYAGDVTDDDLRVRGWLVYDGKSVTSKPLHVRTCPPCQEKGARSLKRYASKRQRAALRRAAAQQQSLPLE